MEKEEPSLSLLEEIRKINITDQKKREKKKSGLREVGECFPSSDLVPECKIKDYASKAKLRSLDVPLDKPKANRIRRAAGFENVSAEVSKWGGIVEQRRKAEQLTFPLERIDTRLVTTEKNFKPSMKTDLEKEVYGLLQGAKLVVEKQETEEELAVKKAMSLQEIREECKRIARDRNLKHRLEFKAARLNKSKSRKYHKILRREKLKIQKADFESLKETNPEAALEILNNIERLRLKERMDLRHKNSKWLRLQGPRVGHDAMVRDLLKENSEMRKELLEKLQMSQKDKDEDENESEDEVDRIIKKVTKDMKSGNSDTGDASQLAVSQMEQEQDASFTRMKNYWEGKKREIEAQRKLNIEATMNEKGKTNLVTDEHLEGEMEDEEEEIEVGELEDEDSEEEIENEDSEEEEEMKIKVPLKKKNIKNKKGGNVEKPTKKVKGKKLKKTKGGAIKIKKITEGTIDDIFNKLEKAKEKKSKKSKNEIKSSATAVEEAEPTELEEAEASICQEVPMETESSARMPSEYNPKILKKRNQKKGETTQENKDVTSTSSNVNSINDRRLGTARPDISFLKRKLENESSGEESDEGFDDIFDNDENIKMFQKEKKDQEEKNKVKNVDTYLAGWGSWGGPGIVPSAKKRRKFTIKAPKAEPNKYSKIGNVIYNEKNDVHANLRKMMVSDLPFPFTTVKDFESSIRQPISRTFVPETVHKKLIAPAVVHKMGKVIYPMNEELLINEHEKRKRGPSKLEQKLDELGLPHKKYRSKKRNKSKNKSRVKQFSAQT